MINALKVQRVRDSLRLALTGTRETTIAGAHTSAAVRATAHPMVRSVFRVSGEDCFVADVACRRIEDVSVLLAQLKETRVIQSSRTAFVLEPVLDTEMEMILEEHYQLR